MANNNKEFKLTALCMGWIDERMNDGYVDGWMDGWMNRSMNKNQILANFELTKF